jgi:hypothetical protein
VCGTEHRDIERTLLKKVKGLSSYPRTRGRRRGALKNHTARAAAASFDAPRAQSERARLNFSRCMEFSNVSDDARTRN